MMFLALILTAAPVLPAEIQAPIGHFGSSIGKAPADGVSQADPFILLPGLECPADGFFPARFQAGLSRTLEQLQQSLDRAPGSEKKLFTRKGELAEVIKLLSASVFSADKSDCTPIKGWQLVTTAPPKKWCAADPYRPAYFTNEKPSWTVALGRNQDGCAALVSTVLFDAKGVARVRLHADWSGTTSVTLVGDRCQNVEFTFDTSKQAFIPSWSSCKR